MLDGIGHAFILVNDQANGAYRALGFYPEDGSIESNAELVIGLTVESSLYPNDYVIGSYFNPGPSQQISVRFFDISRASYRSFINLTQNFGSNSYNLYQCNCVDYVIDAARSAGINLPSSFGGSSSRFDTTRGLRQWINTPYSD